MDSKKAIVCALFAILLIGGTASAQTVELPIDRYVDKCKGAWAGQMIGVCYGAPYEFKFNGKPMTGPLREWKPERIRGAITQDDCYVEMTFLKALEDHGLDITYEQAGKAFAASEYPLWHANRYGRENVRAGIMPPMSGHPDHNRHADDIDFQIEADLFGILCPGLPQESNRLCDVFGHIMNYGDGVYGGMFVAGMYCAAYFEEESVQKVLRDGLACIPEKSEYHRCISDVIAWHKESPNDWLIPWMKIEDKWQDDVDCAPGNPFNIDAKLNGAYIAMGLLYGEGDLLKTLEVSTRCGQDNDCNPSNAVGVLGCMKGYEALGEEWTGGMAAIADKEFSFTDYSFDSLIPACRRMTEAIIERTGGEVGERSYRIARQAPSAPEQLEQWTNQEEYFSHPIPPKKVSAWNPEWEMEACGFEMEPGVRREQYGRKNVLVVHPVNKEKPAVLTATLDLPNKDKVGLVMDVASDERGDFLLKVSVAGELAKEEVIDTKGKWRKVRVDLSAHAGKSVEVRIENCPNDWSFEAAYIDEIRVK